jgi:hypothetical protein
MQVGATPAALASSIWLMRRKVRSSLSVAAKVIRDSGVFILFTVQVHKMNV